MTTDSTSASLTPGPDDQELLSEEAPGNRQLQVGTQKCRRILPAIRHRVGQEAIDADIDVEAAGAQRLRQRGLGERDVMVPEIPVGAGYVLDVGTHGDQPSAGAQAT